MQKVQSLKAYCKIHKINIKQIEEIFKYFDIMKKDDTIKDFLNEIKKNKKISQQFYSLAKEIFKAAKFALNKYQSLDAQIENAGVVNIGNGEPKVVFFDL